MTIEAGVGGKARKLVSFSVMKTRRIGAARPAKAPASRVMSGPGPAGGGEPGGVGSSERAGSRTRKRMRAGFSRKP
jgi:hypothetical protein